MNAAKTVAGWNELRELAKDLYSAELISQLDGSGYINQVLS